MAEPHRLRPHAAIPSIQAAARRFAGDARGATAIEYAMIAGLIFAVIAGSLRLYGARMETMYGRIGTAVSQIE